MTKEQEKEIRSALLGRTVLAEDGRITTLEPGLHLSPGIGDGAGAVRFFGIASRSRSYETKLNRQNTLRAVTTAMQNIGRGLLLREQPDTPACLIRYILTRPVVLVFEFAEDGTPVVTAFCGRGLSAIISMRRAIYAFTDELPEGITVREKVFKPAKQEEPVKEKKKKKEKRNEIQEPAAETPYEAGNQPLEDGMDGEWTYQPEEPQYQEQEDDIQ